MQKTILIIVVLLGLVGGGFFLSKNKSPAPKQAKEDFGARESAVAVTEADRGKVIDPGEHGVSIYRYKSAEGIWQATAEAPPADAKDTASLGVIFAQAKAPQITTPLYQCAFTGFAGKNVGFDTQSNCSGEGKLLEKKPIGYLSAENRPGYVMMIRCRGPAGFYPSLNPNCENPSDRIQASWGTVRAAKIR